jgi:hypothetical protein
MSLIRSRYAVSWCWRLLAVLFSAFLALALFHPAVATAQEVKQIKLTEKHVSSPSPRIWRSSPMEPIRTN